MKIALVMPGRFHGFDLGRALLAQGHEVTVFTNYPGWAAGRFGFPADRVRSVVLHGAVERAIARVTRRRRRIYPEAAIVTAFARWAAAALRRETWDVVHCWSGVSLEWLERRETRQGLAMLMRASAHIEVQDTLLRDEGARARLELDHPSPWMIAREQREYALADGIVVPSTFVAASFASRGVPASQVLTVPLGVDVEAFRPSPAALAARRARILGANRLRLLYVGALSYRKGLFDLERMVEMLDGVPVDIELVGPEMPEARAALARLAGKARISGKRPQSALPGIYAAADLFVFPTIEDGFAVVLAQAKASGLPIVTTTNCAGPDLITEGRDGWVVPIRRPDLLAERVRWCAAHRAALADMADAVARSFAPRDWDAVARDFTDACGRATARRGEPVRG